MAYLPLQAAGQPRTSESLNVPSGVIAKIGGPVRVTVRLVSLPGGAEVIGGNSGVGTLDFGRISYFSPSYPRTATKKDSHALTTTAEFGLELEAPGSSPNGAAMLSAYLAEPSPNCAYLVDGIRLTTAPQVISAHVEYGTITEHRLEMKVPKSAPAGMKRASIIWTVTPEE